MNKLYDMLSDDVTLKNLKRFEEGGDLHFLVGHILNGEKIYVSGVPCRPSEPRFEGAFFCYSVKPKLFKVGNVTLDEQPITEAPELGSEYFAPSPTNNKVVSYTWNGQTYENTWLKNGMCFATKSGAQAVLDLIGWGEV